MRRPYPSQPRPPLGAVRPRAPSRCSRLSREDRLVGVGRRIGISRHGAPRVGGGISISAATFSAEKRHGRRGAGKSLVVSLRAQKALAFPSSLRIRLLRAIERYVRRAACAAKERRRDRQWRREKARQKQGLGGTAGRAKEPRRPKPDALCLCLCFSLSLSLSLSFFLSLSSAPPDLEQLKKKQYPLSCSLPQKRKCRLK